ncbi:hypothetical protein [Pseudonocardia sp.]|uniref:hypothetical protein n=1 Tax=Pseudonocardia sp. TaxID=60912 RepID=UPI0026143F76|nr:hypothetical protein [Pseudonocardia sp.]
MLVEVRPTGRLRGKDPVDVTAALDPVLRALCAGAVDLSRVRVVCDWVQYKQNFREPVDVRIVAPDPRLNGRGADTVEVAVDLRRPVDDVGAALAATDDDRMYLEDWGPGRRSCIWQFNGLYWSHLRLWEEATGQGYESALPGGQSDATNTDGARELIGELFAIWDDLAARQALPEQLYVVELGVGNGSQAATFLDTFLEMDRAAGREYYRRLHYLMCDYSPHVLELARAAVATHSENVSSFVLDAMHPMTALSFLRFTVFLVYISNVYDNLPTDELASIGQREYVVETRAYLPAATAAQIAADLAIGVDALPALVHRLLTLGPPLLAEASPHVADTAAAVAFWRRCWEGLRLAERYVPLDGLDTYEIARGISGEALRPLLAATGDVRMHVGNGAVASFAETMPLLHPYGRLICHDLFVTDTHMYRTGFRGPGKYDGSVVNWVNGPLLAHIGHRKGFDVRFAPFAHRAGSFVQTMTAQVRE